MCVQKVCYWNGGLKKMPHRVRGKNILQQTFNLNYDRLFKNSLDSKIRLLTFNFRTLADVKIYNIDIEN